MSYLCSTVATEQMKINNPTMANQAGDVARLPLIFRDDGLEEIDRLASSCVEDAKKDWDSYETSWDFKKHPMV